MRLFLAVACVVLLGATCTVEVPPSQRAVTPPPPVATEILREASEIALKQQPEQGYWCDRVLLQIGALQMRAGDFDGSLVTLQGSSYPYGRNAGLVELAEAIARVGDRDRAVAVLKLQDDDDWRRDYLDDRVHLQWIEHLIELGDLDSAREAVDQLRSDRYRPDGWRTAAVAYAAAGDSVRAAELFRLAIQDGSKQKSDYARVRSLWETADAQLATGNGAAAQATLDRLLESAGLVGQLARVAALRQAGCISARAKDREAARRFFRQSIDASSRVEARNQINALQQIAEAQAEAGLLEDAQQTAQMIKHSDDDFTQDGYREKALLAIAAAQLAVDDISGAIATALKIEHFLQYRDDALHKVIKHCLAQDDREQALAAANKMYNASRKAAGTLIVARAWAKSGDRRRARVIAAAIDLTPKDWISDEEPQRRFDYRRPATWGMNYDIGWGITSLSLYLSIQRTAEVAEAAMALAQALNQEPVDSYAFLFKDHATEEVIQALARSHASAGSPHEALRWARRIGRSDEIPSKEDHQVRQEVEERIHALMGVAEGILQKTQAR